MNHYIVKIKHEVQPTHLFQGKEFVKMNTILASKPDTQKLIHLLLSARTAMWSMPAVLTKIENKNDSANQNDVAKMMLQK